MEKRSHKGSQGEIWVIEDLDFFLFFSLSLKALSNGGREFYCQILFIYFLIYYGVCFGLFETTRLEPCGSRGVVPQQYERFKTMGRLGTTSTRHFANVLLSVAVFSISFVMLFVGRFLFSKSIKSFSFFTSSHKS
jgi:hypothetical protein